MTVLVRHVLVCSITLLATLATAAAQQPRDKQRPTTGTARITGVVVTADREARPLRRTRVTIAGGSLVGSRMTVTGDDGRFVLDGLPSGRYSVFASKEGYVGMGAGAERPGRIGSGVEVRDGEAQNVRIALPRGAVITGVVTEPNGELATGVNVTVMTERFMPTTGERRMTNLPPQTAVVTDDRGIYRIFALPAGSYYVTALGRPAFGPGVDMQMLSEQEIKRALADLRTSTASPRPDLSAPSSAAAIVEPRRSIAFAPTFHPGTTAIARARSVAVTAGEVRSNVNIDLEYTPVSRVEGTVDVPPGMRVFLMLAALDISAPGTSERATAAGDAGQFSFRGIVPGQYVITARATTSGVRSDASPDEAAFWGRTEVIVQGEDISGVTVSLKPALTLRGTIRFESLQGEIPDLSILNMPRIPIPAGIPMTGPLPSARLEGNQFVIAGVQPGVYRYSALRGVRSPLGRWWLKSLTIAGKEVLDSELRIEESADEAVITFSDRASELSGVVRHASGQPSTEHHMVVFSPDQGTWFLHSRRVAAVRPSTDGRYSIRNLPPGEYLVVLAADLEPNEWFDREMLRTLAATAMRITMGEHETKTLDLTSK